MSFSQKILIPTDLSKSSLLAVDAGGVLARQFESDVVLLYVYDPTLLSPIYALPGAIGAMVDAKDKVPDFEKTVHAELERIAKAHLGGVKGKIQVATLQHQSPADAICQHAIDSGADMIVLSTHGRTGLAHMLIGSVAERVVRHASVPVLTLRSKV